MLPRLFVNQLSVPLRKINEVILSQFTANKPAFLPYDSPNRSTIKNLNFSTALREIGSLAVWSRQLLGEVEEASKYIVEHKKSLLLPTDIVSAINSLNDKGLITVLPKKLQLNNGSVYRLFEMARLKKSFFLSVKAQDEAAKVYQQQLSLHSPNHEKYDGCLVDATLEHGAGECLAQSLVGAAFLQNKYNNSISIKLCGQVYYHHYFLLINDKLIWDPLIDQVYLKDDIHLYTSFYEGIIFQCQASDREVERNEKKYYDGDDKAPIHEFKVHYELPILPVKEKTRLQFDLLNQSSKDDNHSVLSRPPKR
jgi:hypothetical protein